MQAHERLISGVGLSIARQKGAPLLTEASFDLACGDRMVIMGGSGTGKSTLLEAILGKLKIQSGSLEVAGMPAGSAAAHRWLVQNASIVFQGDALFEGQSVGQNLSFPLRLRGTSTQAQKDILRTILTEVGLLDQDSTPSSVERLMQKPVKALSGGQRRRVALARGMVTRPRLLLLDEPTSGLDPDTTRQIGKILLEITREHGTTVFCITHDPVFAEIMQARILKLENGTLHEAPAHGQRGESVTEREQTASPPLLRAKARLVVQQVVLRILKLGVNNLCIALPASFLVGAALAAQSLAGPSWLQQFLPRGVVAAVFLGLGTLVPSLLMIGLSGSSVAAEISQRKQNRQLHYLEFCGASPFFYLGLPLFLGFLLTVPLVILLSERAMLQGARATLWLMESRSQITAIRFWHDVQELLAGDPSLFPRSFLKGICHGAVMGTVPFWMGRRSPPGEEGLRRSICAAVLLSSALVILVDLWMAFVYT
ncbi:MAG: ATP-binding cassette domain-containing protein [Verrucomicrobia bacterium]|nr:ATP-binding cassette domain-containing protein [Verrucomicrobiota bacterium]MCH8510982.1 ATP-binding cassette domain-containing protein [Kiritimatiellia bacterium]